jgi:Undecaprenyl-phosphate galactose phosphotransferase WbaP
MSASPVRQRVMETSDEAFITSSLRTYCGQEADASTWWTTLSMVAVDLVALSTVYWLAVIIRRIITPGDIRFYLEVFPGATLFIIVFAIHGLYPGVLVHPAEEIRRVFHGISTVFLLVLCTTFLGHNAESYSRSIVMLTWLLGVPAVLLARMFARRTFSRYPWWGVPAVIFGSGPSAMKILKALTDRKLGIRVTAVVPGDFLTSTRPVIAHYAILAEPPSKAALNEMIQDQCKGYRHVLLVPDIPSMCSLGITARDIGGEIGLELPQRLCHRSAAMAKRVIDLLLTLPGLVALSLVFLFIALIIKLTSKGPVFYRHTRHGRDGRTFVALKFRTMYENGDSILWEHFQQFPEEFKTWNRDRKLKRDPRVTPVGRWLRRSSLDELPQLCNVLMGHMSLVGPRPIVSAEVAEYGHGYDLYGRVRPGITGLWQVSGRNNTTYSERVAFDEYYVRNWSIWLDIYILVRTAKAVLYAEGAY